MKKSLGQFLFILVFSGLNLSPLSSAQQDKPSFDKSRVPSSGNAAKDFVPPGWKIEEQIAGDLNGDSAPDYALKLVEDQPATDKEGIATERQRALVIVFASSEGKLSRAAVSDNLLQCTRCGGAFYGVVESPANVKIEKGVLVVEQDHGSRNITDTTFRFRYEADTGKLALIGFDLSDTDRLTGNTVSESTNYLTGVRIVTRGKGNKDTTSRTQIAKKRIYLDEIDGGEMETAAYQRLKL